VHFSPSFEYLGVLRRPSGELVDFFFFFFRNLLDPSSFFPFYSFLWLRATSRMAPFWSAAFGWYTPFFYRVRGGGSVLVFFHHLGGAHGFPPSFVDPPFQGTNFLDVLRFTCGIFQASVACIEYPKFFFSVSVLVVAWRIFLSCPFCIFFVLYFVDCCFGLGDIPLSRGCPTQNFRARLSGLCQNLLFFFLNRCKVRYRLFCAFSSIFAVSPYFLVSSVFFRFLVGGFPLRRLRLQLL